jgi:hypothetical protein
MKHITFNKQFTAPTLQIRNSTEQLIADIVDATTEKDKKKLAKLIAIKAKEMRWSDSDLHALLQKKSDPTIRNYTAFVWWSTKTKRV